MISGKLRNVSWSLISTYGSLILLVLITIYCAWYANFYLSGNSDDLVYPYLLQHFKLHDLILPGQHSNILKFPIFVLQAILPFTFITFTIVNIGLVLATIVGWALLLAYLFGKRFLPLIAACLGSILLGSQLLNYDLLGTTIRNIELPIALAFIIFTGLAVQHSNLSRHYRLLSWSVGLLFALTIAGDSFFVYTICSALLVGLAGLWWMGKSSDSKHRLHLKRSFMYVVGFSALGIIIRYLIPLLGIAKYYNAAAFKPRVLPLDHLAPSITTAVTQLLNLFDANIFGQAMSPRNGLVFLNFILLIVGIVGLVYILRDTRDMATHRIRKLEDVAQPFALFVIVLAGLATFAAYIVSDLVVGSDATGVIASLYQERYITLVPLVIIIGIVYWAWRTTYAQRTILLATPLVVALCLLVNIQGVRASHTDIATTREGPIAVANAARANHIQFLLTGYWYGASVRFWSHNQLPFATVAGCNIPQPTFNNRFSWYKPDPAIHSAALVVVRNGIDATYWICSDQQLRDIYGTPDRVIQLGGVDRPALWLYHYDPRTKLVPMSF